MLKILIVDDDPLTRKGIQVLMPWEKHHMEVVGECSNGEEALAFLEQREVDLVLVDIDMPVMDGITFMRTAAKLYPALNYVVLTVHTEFDYVQNVLRLGAIDYIAKTQFDKENFDEILERIYGDIVRKRPSLAGTSHLSWRESKILYPSVYAVISAEPESDDSILAFWELNGLSGKTELYELMDGVWVFTAENPSFIFPEGPFTFMLMRIWDVGEMTYAQLGKHLRKYIDESFFYEYQAGMNRPVDKQAYELWEKRQEAGEDAVLQAKDDLLALKWVYEPGAFEKTLLALKACRLKKQTLYHWLLSLESAWNAAFSELTGETVSLPPAFHCWAEVENWLVQVYRKTEFFQVQTKYSASVVRSILQVKSYVDAHYDQGIDTVEAAKNAHMSYGYFSRCFHDIIGLSFTDYCTQVRMERAKEQLANTDRSIQEIAFRVGYHDEKYFSRAFKKYTGRNPSDYRRLGESQKRT